MMVKLDETLLHHLTSISIGFKGFSQVVMSFTLITFDGLKKFKSKIEINLKKIKERNKSKNINKIEYKNTIKC